MTRFDGDIPETDQELDRMLNRIERRQARPKTLKVRVEMTIEIDLDEYRISYGNETIDTIRSDVRHAVADSARTGGVLASSIVNVDLKD
jgi:hypothetical protein